MSAQRRAARLLAALAAVGILLAPSAHALAGDNEPQPTAWPTVDPPDKLGQASEPQPVQWPSPSPLPGG
ncbi:hypothetical protein ACFV9C_01185 [Kribbella sp. NPDC059898]|uniref:hypothetical protein n=1 Tax=Kribbella sp. NPDC059898 TaxID=3346995 RepID=UPI0036544FCC